MIMKMTVAYVDMKLCSIKNSQNPGIKRKKQPIKPQTHKLRTENWNDAI